MKPRLLSTARLSFPPAAAIAAMLAAHTAHAGTSWDGGGANTNIDTAANWDSDVVNALNGTTVATFGTGGSTATINTNASFTGITINRDGAFAITDGAGSLTVGTGGITVTLPNTTARTHTISESSLILNGNQTWTVTNNTGAARLDVSSLVSGGFNLTKAGTGTLSLTGANTYTGTTTISAGAVSINTLGNVNGGASSLGAPTTVTNGTIALSATLTYTGAATATDRNFTFGGATSNITNASTTNGLLTLDGTIVVSSTNAFNFNPTGGNILVNGVISGTGGNGLFMNGNGRVLTLANANNSFNTTVNLFQGTLSIATISNAGTNSALGRGTNIVLGHNSFNMNPTLQFTGASGGSSSRPIFVQNIATGLGGGSIENTVAGQTLTLSGDVKGNTTSGNPTLTLKGAGNGVLSGIISNNTAASLAITKSGAGTWEFTKVNTYSGLTTVSGGKLTIASTGTINNTSGVSIGAGEFNYNSSTAMSQGVSFSGTGGTLSGTGTITPNVNVTAGNTLAIGNSAGTMAFSGDLTVLGTYSYELNGGLSIADLGDVTGNLALGGILDLVQLGTYTTNQKFTLFAYDGTLSGLFKDFGGINTIADDATFTDAGGIWKLNYNDTTAGLNGGVSASNTYVTITAIPEPNAAALLGGFGLLALLRRRRGNLPLVSDI
jgi:autotransporter-associated beta strand protein